MQHQVIPAGPDTGKAPVGKIDRTRILDPKDYWPNATDCPDWPYETQTRRYEGVRGRVGAESRLEQIQAFLNRGPGDLRIATGKERDIEFVRTFKRGDGNWWGHLGMGDLAPLGRMAENDASLMVEACHIRGYLRKLDAQEAATKEAESRRKAGNARHRLDSFNQSVADGRAELTGLAEAEARHKQRIEDEQAFNRCNAIRQNLRHGHFDACQAAAAIGEDRPEMPQFF